MRGDAANELISLRGRPERVHPGVEGAHRQHRARAGAAAAARAVASVPRAAEMPAARRDLPRRGTSPASTESAGRSRTRRRSRWRKGFFTDTTRLHRLQGLRGRLQAVEPAARRRLALHRHVLRQHRRTSAPPPGGTWPSSSGPCRCRAADGLGDFSWLMLSDVCKHCQRAGCLEACPTGAIIRTEFDTVYVQPDVCNGCGYCVVGLPLRRDRPPRGRRPRLEVHALLRPAEGRHGAGLRQGLPHRFHPVRRPRRAARAGARSASTQLHERGVTEAYLYGADAASQPGTGGLNAFFLLVDKPEVYNLPPDPVAPDEDGGRGLGVDGAGRSGHGRRGDRCGALGRGEGR